MRNTYTTQHYGKHPLFPGNMVLPITQKYAKSLCDKFGKSARKVCIVERLHGERKINREYFQTKVKPKNAQHPHHPIEFIYMVWDPFRLVRVWFFGSGSGWEFAFAFASVASKSVGVFVALPRPRSQHLRPSQQNQPTILHGPQHKNSDGWVQLPTNFMWSQRIEG